MPHTEYGDDGIDSNLTLSMLPRYVVVVVIVIVIVCILHALRFGMLVDAIL